MSGKTCFHYRKKQNNQIRIKESSDGKGQGMLWGYCEWVGGTSHAERVTERSGQGTTFPTTTTTTSSCLRFTFQCEELTSAKIGDQNVYIQCRNRCSTGRNVDGLEWAFYLLFFKILWQIDTAPLWEYDNVNNRKWCVMCLNRSVTYALTWTVLQLCLFMECFGGLWHFGSH